MRGTPSFDRSDIETIIAKDAYGMRNELPKVEPVFPPPPDSAAAAAVPAPVSIYPQESACPGLSSNLIPRSGLKMQKQASSPIHTASNSGRLGKFSPNCALPRQLATYQPPLCQPNRQVSPSQVPHNAYPYQDFRNKYEQGCYSNSQVGYDPFTPQHFCTGYQDFSQYPRSTDQPDWNSLCKYGSVSGDSNRTVPNMNASASEADCNFRVYPNVNPLRPELSTPFNTSPFMQDAPTYSMSIGSHNTTYGISQHNYTYPQVPLTTTPVVTTSPPSEPVSCLMWQWAYWLTGRRTRLRAPQHDLAAVTHTPGFTKSGDMEDPSPSDSQATGQPLDTQHMHWADGVA
ncbi:unnamed protein product [Schistocephalus solidus]|uniref:Wilms tumor protein 1-interacting protein homolog n=1 Tax=Schistocephalus solidus TaxID=70667 RepID=A0A183SP84_SCHSO|nr:unnamed protein product [Schistocephalus solidus]